jgi:hypothetical protein
LWEIRRKDSSSHAGAGGGDGSSQAGNAAEGGENAVTCVHAGVFHGDRVSENVGQIYVPLSGFRKIKIRFRFFSVTFSRFDCYTERGRRHCRLIPHDTRMMEGARGVGTPTHVPLVIT